MGTPIVKAAEIARVLLGAVQSFSDQPLDDLTVVVLKQIGVPLRDAGAAPQKFPQVQRRRVPMPHG